MKIFGLDSRYLGILAKIRSRDRRNRIEEYRAVQEKRLVDTLASAKRSVPFQQKRLNGSVIPDLAEIPIVEKKDMMSNMLDTISRDELAKLNCTIEDLAEYCENSRELDQHWFRDYALLSQTHGTTGTPSRIFRTRPEMQQLGAINLLRTGYDALPISALFTARKRKVACILFDSTWTTSNQAVTHYGKKYSRFAEIRGYGMAEEPYVLAEKLNEFQPDELRTYPVYHCMFARMQRAGQLNISPRYISSGADLMTPEAYELIKSAFPQAKILDNYGATECHPLAAKCEHGKLHLNIDFSIFQPVDKEDRPVGPGVWSDSVAVTCLVRRFQPVIRYRLTDSVRVLEEPCTCGNALPAMEIRGRRFPGLPIYDNHGNETELSSVDIRRVTKPLNINGKYVLHVRKRSEFEFLVHCDHDSEAERESYRQKLEPQMRKTLVDFFATRDCDRSVQLKFQFAPQPLKPIDVKHQRFQVHI